MKKHLTVLIEVDNKLRRHLMLHVDNGYTLCGLATDMQSDEGNVLEFALHDFDKKVNCPKCLKAVAYYKRFEQ